MKVKCNSCGKKTDAPIQWNATSIGYAFYIKDKDFVGERIVSDNSEFESWACPFCGDDYDEKTNAGLTDMLV